MDGQGYDLAEVVQSISPSALDYTEWVEIGMALHHEGYSFDVWDNWSRQDSKRYKGNGAMEKKWQGFGPATNPVKGGTVVEMARSYGWVPSYDPGHALGWDDTEVIDERIVKDVAWVEPSEIREPTKWDPAQQIIDYLEAVFDADEIVGYVTESWEKDGRFIPASKGDHTRTAGELIEAVSKHRDDLAAALGDYNPVAGAWIRFNPLDGGGVRNDNVTEFKYALIESDAMDLEKQKAIIEELELPTVVLVHSGGKSLHAIVRVDAKDYAEYRKRVDFLYSICRKNGLDVDTQNKNPSRLSRLPGCVRGEKKQFIVATHIGKETWAEWNEWIEALNDGLPDICEDEDLDDLPERPDLIVEDILSPGDKMMISGRSKAGKSYALIELCCAIASGGSWLGKQCRKGKVLYINLELKQRNRKERFKVVRDAIGASKEDIQDNVHYLDLRGMSAPLEHLSNSIIRRASKHRYDVIIIDPIYKVIAGDENSAEHVAKFCNQLDKLAETLGCAVVYCHHHSKGAQGAKSSMDRASGSGVFARDADVQLDIIELPLNDSVMMQQESDAVGVACSNFLDAHPDKLEGWRDVIPQDNQAAGEWFLDDAKSMTKPVGLETDLLNAVCEARIKANRKSAWRIETTLRELPSLAPINIWFDWPLHPVDDSGVLTDIKLEDDPQRGKKAAIDKRKQERLEKGDLISMAITYLTASGEKPLRQSIADFINKTGAYTKKAEIEKKDIKNWTDAINKQDGKRFTFDEGSNTHELVKDWRDPRGAKK